MAQSHGTRVLGERHVKTLLAGSALAKGDIVQTTEATGSNTVDNAATNTAVRGVALAAADSAANVEVDQFRPGDRFWVKVSSGTVSATLMGKFGDIVDELSVTTSASNNDVRFVDWDGITTDFAVVEYTTPESATPTILA